MAEIKGCYAVEAVYVEGAADKRAPYREQHLARIEKLAGEGVCLIAGGYEDMISSLLVFDVSDEAAARAIIESDVYWHKGIWTDFTVRKLNRVVS